MISTRLARGLAPLLIGVPCVLVVTRYGELSVQALLAVTTTGAAVGALGMLVRAGNGAPAVGPGARGWLLWLVAACAWEMATLTTALPTLSDLADVVLASPPVRAVAAVGWLLVGGWLLARPSGREQQ